jgi:hypothetical protein
MVIEKRKYHNGIFTELCVTYTQYTSDYTSYAGVLKGGRAVWRGSI